VIQLPVFRNFDYTFSAIETKKVIQTKVIKLCKSG